MTIILFILLSLVLIFGVIIYNLIKPVKIEVELRHNDAKVPHRKRKSDAGFDLTCLQDYNIAPNEIVNIDCGMAVVAPKGFYWTVEGRSSLYKSGITPFRGVIDATYSGPITITLMNVGKQVYYIAKGDRVAQLILHRQYHPWFAVVAKISPAYNIRGTAGWGSSGK